MRSVDNPFNPGSGLRPPALVGRDGELELLDTVIARTANGLTSRGIVVSGLRGVGKTVLLREMRNRAEASGWFVVSLEARGDRAGEVGLRQILARDMTVRARSLRPGKAMTAKVKQALSSVSAFNAKVGGGGIELGVEIEPGRADSGNIEVDLPELVEDLCQALAERKSGFALFIDEMQDVDKDLLRALLVTQHQAGQREWPFYIVGAGLPHLPTVLATVRSYAERLFEYRTVGTLAPDVARRALTEPVRSRAVEFNRPALTALLEASGGYPYFLQEYGKAAWEVSLGPTILADDARAAVTLGLERLDQGFFSSRWERATKAERRVLVAMAADNDAPSGVSEVARRMGVELSGLSPYRNRLIRKGLIFAPEHGMLAYTVPGMAAFVHRHREDA